MLSKGILIYHECVQLNLIFQLRTNLQYKLCLYLSHHFNMIYIYWLGFGLHVDHIQLVILQWLNIQSSTTQTIIDVHFCGVHFYITTLQLYLYRLLISANVRLGLQFIIYISIKMYHSSFLRMRSHSCYLYSVLCILRDGRSIRKQDMRY